MDGSTFYPLAGAIKYSSELPGIGGSQGHKGEEMKADNPLAIGKEGMGPDSQRAEVWAGRYQGRGALHPARKADRACARLAP